MHDRSHGFHLAAPKPLKVRERSGIGLAATFETHSDRRYATGFGAQRVLFKRQQMMREKLRSPKITPLWRCSESSCAAQACPVHVMLMQV